MEAGERHGCQKPPHHWIMSWPQAVRLPPKSSRSSARGGEAQRHEAVLKRRFGQSGDVVERWRRRRPSTRRRRCARAASIRACAARGPGPQPIPLASSGSPSPGRAARTQVGEYRLDHAIADRGPSHEPLRSHQILRRHDRFWSAPSRSPVVSTSDFGVQPPGSGVADVNLQQEAIKLRLGEGIGAFLFQWVLRRQDMERSRQIVPSPRDGDVMLLHRLEQC